MNETQDAPSPAKRAIPLLDVLLRLREGLQRKHVAPALTPGVVDVHWMATFIDGYGYCLHEMGVQEGRDNLFGEWLREVKGAWPGEGWATAYLQETGGDNERALRKYLDFVAEFRALPSESLAAIPYHGQGDHPAAWETVLTPARPPVSTLDFLLEIRGRVGNVPGRMGMYIGDVTVRRMAGLIAGYRQCLEFVGASDEEYSRFLQWLHQEKDISQEQGWEQPLLRAARGDQEQAILTLLDYAAEFRSAA
jgi:hypothetical protein